MRKRILLGLLVGGILWAASPAWASLMIDGNIGVGDYTIVLNDGGGETGQDYYDTGLDIDALHFDDAAEGGTDWYWFGLATKQAIDTDGDPTSFLFETRSHTVFYDAAQTTPSYYVRTTMTASSTAVQLFEWSGAQWNEVTLTGTDYDVAVGDALEVRIDQLKMPNLPATPYVKQQLDGSGEWDDDQLAGLVPEPTTLALLGAGFGLTLVFRRRR